MSAHYWCLITDSMFGDGMTWPDEIRLAGPEWLVKYPVRPAVPHVAPGSWRLIEDDGADAELDGREVNLILRYEDGVPGIAERHMVTR